LDAALDFFDTLLHLGSVKVARIMIGLDDDVARVVTEDVVSAFFGEVAEAARLLFCAHCVFPFAGEFITVLPSA
jgi:hypothetical protein